MHIVRNSAPVQLPYAQLLQPGEWLMQDDTAFSCAVRAERGSVTLSPWIPENPFRVHEGWKPNPEWVGSILLIRSGAIGDLLLLSPCIAALKAKYPSAMINLACYGQHQPLIRSFGVNPAHYPVDMTKPQDYDLIIPLENIIETSTEKGVHATDAFAEALGVTVTDYKPVYRVTDDEQHEALFKFPRGNGTTVKRKPRIGVQLHASSIVRNYPVQLWNAVLVKLFQAGWEIMLLGDRDSIPNVPGTVKDCSSLSFREAAAVLSTCDVFCGVDSSFLNLCPALGVPAIGLFGPVDFATRVKEGNGQVALWTHAECAPCGWTNSRAGQQWPSNGPCAKLGYCEPMAKIDPERILAAIKEATRAGQD